MWFLLIFRGSEQVCITKCGILEFPLHGGSYSPPKHELDLGNILLLAKASAASVAFFFSIFYSIAIALKITSAEGYRFMGNGSTR